MLPVNKTYYQLDLFGQTNLKFNLVASALVNKKRLIKQKFPTLKILDNCLHGLTELLLVRKFLKLRKIALIMFEPVRLSRCFEMIDCDGLMLPSVIYIMVYPIDSHVF